MTSLFEFFFSIDWSYFVPDKIVSEFRRVPDSESPCSKLRTITEQSLFLLHVGFFLIFILLPLLFLAISLFPDFFEFNMAEATNIDPASTTPLLQNSAGTPDPEASAFHSPTQAGRNSFEQEIWEARRRFPVAPSVSSNSGDRGSQFATSSIPKTIYEYSGALAQTAKTFNDGAVWPYEPKFHRDGRLNHVTGNDTINALVGSPTLPAQASGTPASQPPADLVLDD